MGMVLGSLQLLIIAGIAQCYLILETYLIMHTTVAGLQNITSCTVKKKKEKNSFTDLSMPVPRLYKPPVLIILTPLFIGFSKASCL